MMVKKIVLFFIALTTFVFAQSFTYEGPSELIMDWGATAKTAHFYFTYQNCDGLTCSGLTTRVDGGDPYPEANCIGEYTRYERRDIPLAPGVHTITFALISLGASNWVEHQATTVTVTVKFPIRFENNYGSGKMYIFGQEQSVPTEKTFLPNQTVNLQAVDGNDGTNDWIWNSGTNPSKWERRKYNGNNFELVYTRSFTYSILSDDASTTVRAYLKRLYHVNFASSASVPFLVNGVSYSGSTPNFDIVESNKITLSANNYEENNILFVADHWDYGTYITAGTWEWYPEANVTNNLYYKGRPIPYDRNLHFNSYDPLHPTTRVKLYWNVYPNSDVKYQIWRKVYQNDILINTAKLATLNNSITTYTDYDYYIRPAGEGDVDLSYDVRPVYTPSGVAQDENFVGWLHGDNANMSKEYVSNEIEKVEDYSLSNYPNPFNPKTTIEYQLPKAGEVTLKVYNALGKEVANLVNDFKTEGRHTVDFDGSSLASGIYYCEFRVNDFTSIKKMLMIK